MYLVSLSVNKACGYDNIPACLLKDAAEVIASPYIFNLSLQSGELTCGMKVIKVTPIFKNAGKKGYSR